MPAATYQAIVAAPGFALGVRCDDEEIIAIEFIPPHPEQAPATPLAAEAVRQLRAYLTDPASRFGLPLRPSGTTFQRRVWSEIAAIPVGVTLTYGQVAKNLRNAPRAVANGRPAAVPLAGTAVGRVGRSIGRTGRSTSFARRSRRSAGPPSSRAR